MVRARSAIPRLVWLAVALLTGCSLAGGGPEMVPTPAVVPVVSTPFVAYTVADPPARLHDRPGGEAGPPLARGLSLQVEAVTTDAEGRLWYRVITATGAAGWLPADALRLVGDRPPPTATSRPSPVATPTRPSASASPTPRPLVVATNGLGLFLRAQPGQGEIVRSYPDGTPVTPLGEETRLDGRRWLKVRTPDGREGWMAAEYLRPAGS